MTNLLIRLFVKDSQNTGEQRVRTAYGNLAGFAGIVSNILLFAFKLVAGVLSGSISIIADAFNNLADMGSSVVTLLGFKIAAKPADKEHPFGHGRMEYMSGFMVAVAILLVGFELLKGAFEKIIDPVQITVSTVVVVILTASILVKLWMFLFYRNIGRRINSSAIAATAKDSLNDVISTAAVLVSTILFNFTGINFDGYIGAVVALFILYGGYSAAKEMLNPLLGEAPDPELVKAIRDGVMSYEGFVGIHDMVVHSYGPGRVFVSLHVEVDADSDIVEVHEITDLCEHELGERLGIELVVHMDPIATNDEHINELKAMVYGVVVGIDSGLNIHDFRVVDGVNRTNLIFDVAVPYGTPMTDSELRTAIQNAVWAIDGRYYCVIDFDNVYAE